MEGDALKGEKKKITSLDSKQESQVDANHRGKKADKMLIRLPEERFKQRQSKSEIQGESVLTGFCPGCIKKVKGSNSVHA